MWVLTGNWLHPHFVFVVVVVQSGTRAAISAGDLRGRGAGRFPLFLFGLRAGKSQVKRASDFRSAFFEAGRPSLGEEPRALQEAV